MKAINMSRRRLVQALPAGLAAPALAAPAGSGRPNILFILVDDMDYGIFQQMPRVKQLITQRGVEFQNHFVSLSICCASRATILRGQFGHNHGVRDNGPPAGGFERFYLRGLESSTVGVWLQSAGYRTALIGKYLNNYPHKAPGPNHIPQGWDTWLVPNGGDEYRQLNYTVNDNGQTVAYGNAPEDHFHDLLTQRANSFLRAAAADPPSRPFFLYLSPYLPHGPSLAPERYLKLFRGLPLPRPPSFNEADVSDKPRWLQRLPLLDDTVIRRIQGFYRRQRQAAQAIDDTVQSVLNTLEATGQLDNTYIVFSSDNGYFHGEHRIPGDKRRAYEESIRVPLLIRGPGIPAGRTVSQLSCNVDLAPTFAAMAGVTPPAFVDGRSLVPLFSGTPPTRWRQSLLLESQTPEANSIYQSYVGLRTVSGKSFVLWDYGFGEYYDLRTDPYQLDNQYPTMPTALKSALATQLRSLENAGGAALRKAEEVVAG
ncbi:sulfatase family protein [Azohydromonas australica]|uniref:sulfatase family protein n=1 Tax=Azohydromonas australica TaxID=364039 RepID=UPI000686ED49|nr:sulfatase [Azohydromonas australica]